MERLVFRTGGVRGPGRVLAFLEQEVWPLVPAHERGQRLSREEEDEILGYGEHGA